MHTQREDEVREETNEVNKLKEKKGKEKKMKGKSDEESGHLINLQSDGMNDALRHQPHDQLMKTKRTAKREENSPFDSA